MRVIITSCLAALAVAFTAGGASAQHGSGPGGGHGVPVYSGGHAPAYYPPTHYSPPAHYSHGGYAVQPGVGFGVYAGPTYAPAVGVYGGPAVGVSPYSSGYGTTYGHHRFHH